MLATGVTMSLGAEQGSLLQVASVLGDAEGMSFAKSFGEMTAGVGVPGAKPAGQMLSDGSVAKTAVVEKGAGAIAIKQVQSPVETPNVQMPGDQEALDSAPVVKSLHELNSMPADVQAPEAPVKVIDDPLTSGGAKDVAAAAPRSGECQRRV